MTALGASWGLGGSNGLLLRVRGRFIGLWSKGWVGFGTLACQKDFGMDYGPFGQDCPSAARRTKSQTGCAGFRV